MDDRTQFLKEITEAFGPPRTRRPDPAPAPEGFCQISRDNIGSFIARKQGTSAEPKIMVAGHMDEVAFMVTDVEPSGYLRMRPLGGWWPHVPLGQRVRIRRARASSRDRGVEAPRPEAGRAEERPRVQRPFVTWASGRGLTARRPGRGDFAVPHGPFETLANPHQHVVKAWDNRIGCALAVDLLSELRRVDHPNTVYGVATVQEEIGLRGAATSAEQVMPDIAFAVDVGLSRDTPGYKNMDKSPERLGAGASLLLLEGNVVSHPRLARFVQEVAEEEKIPHHLTSIEGGGTDANRFQITGRGIPSMAICVPSRYIHSHSSLLDRRDYEAALRLHVAVVRRLDSKTVARIRG
jgi:endoglucanase